MWKLCKWYFPSEYNVHESQWFKIKSGIELLSVIELIYGKNYIAPPTKYIKQIIILQLPIDCIISLVCANTNVKKGYI